MSLETRIAKSISIVLHPILVPFYGFLTLMFTGSFVAHIFSLELKLAILGLIFLVTVLLPSIFVLLLKRKQIISSVHLENRAERYLPYGMTMILYAIGFYHLYNSGLPQILAYFLLAAALTLLAVIISNYVTKISAHMVGIAGLAASCLILNNKFEVNLTALFLFIVFLGGLVGYARLTLNAHTPKQLYWGAVIGFFVQFLILHILV